MIVLYPSYSFETLSTDRTVTEAEELLAAWTAVFHPALIEKFNEIPRWESASIPPYNASDQPILIPPCCESFMNDDWFKQQEDAGAVLVRKLANRNEIFTELFRSTKIDDHGFDAEYVADFFALGTVYFLTDLLVRQLHYMSMMDDSQLTTQVFDSLKSYRKGEIEKAKDHLRQAFEAVCQSKEYFYPSQTYFLDLTLVTPTTTGESLRELLNSREKANIFLSCKLLENLSETAPETFSVLKSACDAGKIGFIADDSEEKSLTLLPILDAADRILYGISVFREQLNVTPKIYGRLHLGLTPVLPQLLKLAGFNGAVHFALLDGWHIKEKNQSKIIWQGVDGTKIDALVRYPQDGASNLEFFGLAEKLGQTINNDQSPTAVFAQFPGQNSFWLNDLRRMSQYASSLGKFSDIVQYFENTPQSGGVQNFSFGKYPGNALTEAVAANEKNPISYWNGVYRENTDRLVRSAFETILTLLNRKITDRPLAEQFADAIVPNKNDTTNILVVNPLSFPRRIYLDVSNWESLPPETAPIVLARETTTHKEIVVDVPPLGYAFIENNPQRDGKVNPRTDHTEEKKHPGAYAARLLRGLLGSAETKSDPDLVRKSEDDLGNKTKRTVYVLENEYFSAKIDAATGMLRSILTNNTRFNRLSQQLGFRLPKEKRAEDERRPDDPNRGYAIQAADEIFITQTGPITGRLTVKGRLVLPDGSVAATFSETITIRRKSRLLEFDLELQPNVEPGGNPCDSYFAVRYAWNDNTLDMRGGLADAVHAISADRLQSPKFVDLRNEKSSLTFFTEGLPFHRRFGERQLDTILIAKGETVRKFRFGIGVDVKQLVPASWNFLVQKDDFIVPAAEPPKNLSGWLFQIGAKNVIALHWEPILEDAKPVGFKVFLMETEGRRAHFAFHSFLAPIKAIATNLLGEEMKELKTDADTVLIDMHGYELLILTVNIP